MTKNYGLRGVGDFIQLGKNGDYLVFDGTDILLVDSTWDEASTPGVGDTVVTQRLLSGGGDPTHDKDVVDVAYLTAQIDSNTITDLRHDVDDVADGSIAPMTEVLGDRYLITNAGVHADWDGVAILNNIVEFDGVNWVTTYDASADTNNNALTWNIDADEWLHFDGTSWHVHAGAGTTYTAGAGIALDGNTINSMTGTVSLTIGATTDVDLTGTLPANAIIKHCTVISDGVYGATATLNIGTTDAGSEIMSNLLIDLNTAGTYISNGLNVTAGGLGVYCTLTNMAGGSGTVLIDYVVPTDDLS